MKKGFTLVELLAVIIIIGVVALISVPITQHVLESSKQKAYNIIIDNIEQAASNYSIYNELGYNELFKSIKVSEIQSQGYLTVDNIIDPRDNSVIDGCVLYRWKSADKKYEFKYSENCNEKDFYPELTINVLNDSNEYWVNEKLKFTIEGEYRDFKYCVTNEESDCIKDIDYLPTAEIDALGENIYVCATGYFGEEIGNSTCTKAYNIDYENPEISYTKATTTNKIVVNSSCNDLISGVSKVEYSINDKSYQNSPVFSDLKTGTYNLKIKCIDNAGRYTIESEDVTLPDVKQPVIAQASQTPSSGTWVLKRVIRITFDGTNVEEPKYYYSLDGKEWIEVSDTTVDVTFTSNGYLYAKTVDASGNTANASTYTVMNIDSASVETPTIAASDSKSSESWHTSNFTLTFNTSSASSSISGITYYYGTSSSNMTNTGSSVTVSSNTSGTTYYVKACNGAGTCSDTVSYIIRLDKTTPSISLSGIPSEITIGDSYSLPTSKSFGISGESYTSCSVGNTNSLSVGSHTLSCTATSKAGLSNSVSKSIYVKDNTPSITCGDISITKGSSEASQYPNATCHECYGWINDESVCISKGGTWNGGSCSVHNTYSDTTVSSCFAHDDVTGCGVSTHLSGSSCVPIGY